MTAFVLLPLIIIVVAYIFFSMVRVPLNRTRQVVSLYLAVLLVSAGVFYGIAEPGESDFDPLPAPDSSDERNWEESDRHINAFYEALHDGRLEEYEGAVVKKEWSFDYDKERLLITIPDYRQHGAYGPIAIKRKDVNDGKVDVGNYAITPISNGTLPGNLPEVTLLGNRLEIIRPQPIRIETFRFFDDFTSAQFSGKGLAMGDRGAFYYYGGHQILYLQIPLDLEIDTDDSTTHSIFYIEE